MKRIFTSIANFSLTTLGNSLLIASGVIITVCAVGLTAFYLFKYMEETPETHEILCWLELKSEGCPQYEAELNNMQQELDRLAEQTRNAERKLSLLQKIEQSVDTITLFDTHKIGTSDFTVTVGSVYRTISDGDNSGFKHFFCYINLPDNGSVSRDIHIRRSGGNVDITEAAMREAGISVLTLEYARSKCKPMLIGG